MAGKRNSRQDAIRAIIRSKSVETQKELVNELIAEGYSCTQATVSRDISDMGIRKHAGGAYVLREDLRFQEMMTQMVVSVEHVNNLAVVKTRSGIAQGVAAAIDDADLPGIVGTLAGDDTILVIHRDEMDAQELEQTVARFAGLA